MQRVLASVFQPLARALLVGFTYEGNKDQTPPLFRPHPHHHPHALFIKYRLSDSLRVALASQKWPTLKPTSHHAHSSSPSLLCCSTHSVFLPAPPPLVCLRLEELEGQTPLRHEFGWENARTRRAPASMRT